MPSASPGADGDFAIGARVRRIQRRRGADSFSGLAGGAKEGRIIGASFSLFIIRPFPTIAEPEPRDCWQHACQLEGIHR